MPNSPLTAATTQATATSPSWGDDARVQWYGERGIVNTIVNRIASAKDFAVTVRLFLSAIKWADGGSGPDWLNQVTHARFLVEIGLADFGNPDLILVCKVEEEKYPYLVFIEAKAGKYAKSAGSNKEGMTPGYNSTINGQLSLKYRFACALAKSTPTSLEVTETAELFRQYEACLNDYAKRERHLLKGAVIDMLQGFGLLGLPEERCCYVALTTDEDPRPVFEADEDIRPVFRDASGSDQFSLMKSRYGWLGYQNLEKAIGLNDNQEYRNACYGMLPSQQRRQRQGAKKGRGLDTLNTLSAEDAQFIEQVLDSLARACAPSRTSVRENAGGSYSLMINGVTEAAISPQDSMFVGIRVGDDGLSRIHQPLLFPVTRKIGSATYQGFTFTPEETDLTTNSDIATLIDRMGKLYSLK